MASPVTHVDSRWNTLMYYVFTGYRIYGPINYLEVNLLAIL